MGIEICLIQRHNPVFGGGGGKADNCGLIPALLLPIHFALILHSQFPELFLTHLEKLLINTFLIGVL